MEIEYLNPTLLLGYNRETEKSISVSINSEDEVRYSLDDYDVKVTFLMKVKPFAPGTIILNRNTGLLFVRSAKEWQAIYVPHKTGRAYLPFDRLETSDCLSDDGMREDLASKEELVVLYDPEAES